MLFAVEIASLCRFNSRDKAFSLVINNAVSIKANTEEMCRRLYLSSSIEEWHNHQNQVSPSPF